jgi:uncharacterized protein
MLSLLPDYADPLRLCALGKAYKGAIPLAELPRLAPLLTSTEGEAAFVLAFDTDADRRPTVSVAVEARLALQCQRCLGTVMRDVKTASRLVVVTGPDEAERLPDDVDPLLVEDGRIALRALIEDELILAVPTAATHRPEECAVDLAAVNAPHAEEQGEPKPSPFAVLADLKSDEIDRD